MGGLEQAWCEQSLKEIPVAVNVSGVQFRDAGFPDRILRTLEETGLNPELLDLEFTESVLLKTSDELQKSLRGLHTASIVDAVIGLGHKLDLQVVAEGVETEEQLAYLREHGCDGAQGFLCGQPEAARSFEKYLT